MCLVIYSKPEEKTAKEDIVVYKVISLSNTSLYANFKYNKRRLYRLKKKLQVEINNDSYFRIRVNRGFHSYSNLYTHTPVDKQYNKIVEMIIPKGAKYYKGVHSDGRLGFVSSSIRTKDLKAI